MNGLCGSHAFRHDRLPAGEFWGPETPHSGMKLVMNQIPNDRPRLASYLRRSPYKATEPRPTVDAHVPLAALGAAVCIGVKNRLHTGA
jgi:hypothetical protein